MAFDWAQQSSALQRAMQSRGSGGFESPWYLSTKNLQREATGTRTSGNFNPFLNPAQQGFLADNSYQTLMAKRQAEMVAQSQYGQQAGSQSMGNGSFGSPSDGSWAGVNKWDSYVQQASAATGVPGNVIKSIMMIESQGVLDAISPETGYGRYFGLMQIGPTSDVPEYMKSQSWLAGNPYNQILAGATELKNKYRAIGASDWSQAAGAYFGYGTDVTGTTTSGYIGQFNKYMQQLQSATRGGGSASLGGSYSGGGGALQTMFGGKATTPGWGAFGAESGNGLYGYGTDYGLNGTQHTGWDIPMPVGSPLYAPGPAKVICSGTGNGLEGCGAFNDYFGQGAGRIELELANGVRVIYGHSSTANVRPGQYVQAGTLLGTSGGMNSPHTHLEVRVPDRNMPSGYRVVDAVQFFGGYSGGVPANQQSSGVLNSPSMYGWALTRALLNGRR